MRIAFDARPLIGSRTGVGVWLEGLLRGLLQNTDWSFLLVLPRRIRELGINDLSDRVVTDPSPLPLPGTLWLTTVAGPRLAGRADVLVGTLGILPRRVPVPSVLVVHDITPRTLPGWHTVANRFCFNAYFEDSLGRADVIVCVSEATRAAVASVSAAAGRRALVIGEGIEPTFTPAPEGSSPEKTRLQFADGRPYFLMVGTLEPRKGIATVIRAHARLLGRRPDAPDLVLAGGRGWGGGFIERALAGHPDRARVHLPGYVPRVDAVELLRHAEAAIVASEEEGFGLSLAEAMACGTPCISSDAPALVEVAAGAARVVPRGDDEALSGALAAVLEPPEHERLHRAALERSPHLRWGPIVDAWTALLTSLA